MNKKYDITQCALYKCSSKKRLEQILKIEPKSIKNIINNIEYNSFCIPKKDNTDRLITSPCKDLKKIQRRILRLIENIEKPEWVISGTKGKSYVDNGIAHKNSKYCITMDIKSFYPNCQREYVYQFFKRSLQTPSDIAEILTNIVTWKQGIPTGCPTSQLIAYFSYKKMFDEIFNVATFNNCIFTLYVDDMTLSSHLPINKNNIVNKINCILRRYGHKLKNSKIKYFSESEFKLITGVAVSPDNKILVSNALRNKIKSNFDKIKNKSLLNEEDKLTLQTLNGQIQAAQNIEHDIFSEINRIANNIIVD